MTPEAGGEVLAGLLARGLTAAEVLVKRGRSRRFELDRAGATTLSTEESGWAVRAGAGAASFFAAGAGAPSPDGPWPEPVGETPLELPPAWAVEGWSEPPELAEPLLSEAEGWSLLHQLSSDLTRRRPGAVLRALLEDGSSELRILNHHGLDARSRGRLASLRLEASDPALPGAVATLELAERCARRLPFAALADRLVDLLAVRGRGSIGGGRDVDMVLAPEVAARLLAPLVSVFVDRERDRAAALLGERDGRVGSPAITLVDDGRAPRGPLCAPVDGEGVPTGRRALVVEGRLERTILPWNRSGEALGCRARPGWRDLPRVAPSHCYLLPADVVSPASLVEDLRDGIYLLDAGDAEGYDLAAGRISVRVWGFRIAGGRPLHPLGAVRLVGDPRRLLPAVCAVARDLRFSPLVAMIGAPSVLVRGFTLETIG